MDLSEFCITSKAKVQILNGQKDLELFKRIGGGVYLESDNNTTTSKAEFKGGTTVGIRERKKTYGLDRCSGCFRPRIGFSACND